MNMFSYYITTHFIPNNKDYNSYRNLHLVYQMYPRCKRKYMRCTFTWNSSNTVFYVYKFPLMNFSLRLIFTIHIEVNKYLHDIASN